MQVISFLVINKAMCTLHLILITLILSSISYFLKKPKNWEKEGEKKGSNYKCSSTSKTVWHLSRETFCIYQWLPLHVSEKEFNMLHKIHYILRPFPIYATINQESHLFKVTYGELITQKILTSFSKLKVLYCSWHSYT